MGSIEAFKADLDSLRNQQSVVQAKLDEANRHIAELNATLKGMGFNSLDEAKAAYAKQLQDAEKQHSIVQKLIEDIKAVDQKIPSREEVTARLAELSKGNFEAPKQVPVPPTENATPLMEAPSVSESSVDLNVDQSVAIENNQDMSQVEPIVNTNQSEGSIDLGDLLFASL